MPLRNDHLAQAVTGTVVAIVLSLIWGAMLTIVITLVARELGV